MTTNQIIHGLWIGNSLSAIELLCIQSFIKNGHRFYLWTYNDIKNTPEAVVLKDANEIILQNEIFNYNNSNKFGHGKGSYAGFSDLFRYKLLYEYGGIWVDMDVTCLKSFDFSSAYLFRFHHKIQAVGNILKCPKQAPIMLWCYHQTLKQVNAENTNWMLPIEILNKGIEKYSLQSNILKMSNNDDWTLVVKLLKKDISVSNDWYAIHWMNEEFRRLSIKKNKVIKTSLLSNLYKQYNIQVEQYSFINSLLVKLKLSRLYYIFISINARLIWHLTLVKNFIKKC